MTQRRYDKDVVLLSQKFNRLTQHCCGAVRIQKSMFDTVVFTFIIYHVVVLLNQIT